MDIGYEIGIEAFSAMLTLTLLPRASSAHERQWVAELAHQVRAAQRGNRFAFFPNVTEFAADTDCTAVAAAALFQHGLIGDRQLGLVARELQLSAAPSSAPEHECLTPAVFMVYWDDTAETRAKSRGRKHDAVACANVLDTLHSAFGHAEDIMAATLRFVSSHLTTGGYLSGTRYYPAPEAFLHSASKLCTRCKWCADALVEPLQLALAELTQLRPAREQDSLSLALRLITADNLGDNAYIEEFRELLLGRQRTDGSWDAHAYYRMGNFPIYFGSTHLTTAFSLRALRTQSINCD